MRIQVRHSAGRHTHPDTLVKLNLLLVILLRVERVEADVVVDQLFPNLRASPVSFAVPSMQSHSTYFLLECIPLLKCQTVGLGNDRNNVDDLAQLLHHNDVDRAEGVARRVDEEQSTMDARVLDVTVALRGQLLTQVRAVLVLDVLDYRVPAREARRRVRGGFACAWGRKRGSCWEAQLGDTYQFSLLTWSP